MPFLETRNGANQHTRVGQTGQVFVHETAERTGRSARDVRRDATRGERIVGDVLIGIGDAYDNAMAEAFFATFECELLDRRRFRSQAEARMAVFYLIEGFYNPTRRYSSLGYLSPIEFEASKVLMRD